MSKAKVIGLDVTVKGIKDDAPSNRKAIKVMRNILDKVGKRADELCPKDTNLLVNSRVNRVEIVNGSLEAEITYGNSDAYYALYVHEDTEAFHEPPTTHHYLEKALDEFEDWADEQIATLAAEN